MRARSRWPDDLRLLDLAGGIDTLTLRDLFMAILVLGGIGSGKTSGPFQTILRALARIGTGMLLLCIKRDAANTYERWLTRENRSADIVRFSLDGRFTFNFLDYIVRTNPNPHRAVAVATDVLVEVSELIARARFGDTDREKAFFKSTTADTYRAALTILHAADGHLALEPLSEFLSSLPSSPEDAERAANRGHPLFSVAAVARARLRSGGDDVETAARFVLHDWPRYGHDTRESIRATSQTVLRPLTDARMCARFGRAPGPTEEAVTPEDVIGSGRVVIVDIPVHVDPIAGKVGAIIWKRMVQQATLRRAMDGVREDTMRPVAIVADEAQEVLTSGDDAFVTTAREARGISVFATPTINSFAGLGEAGAQALLASLRCRFICNTDDPRTTEWLLKCLGTAEHANRLPGASSNDRALRVRDLRELRQGGGRARCVDAIVLKGGETFSTTGRPWLKAGFPQELDGRGPIGRVADWVLNRARIVV